MTKRIILGLLVALAVVVGILAAPNYDPAPPNSAPTSNAQENPPQQSPRAPSSQSTSRPTSPISLSAKPMSAAEEDQALAAAQAAAIAMATQPAGETLSERQARLNSLFAPGSTSPATLPVLSDDGIDNHAVEVGDVNWIDPYEDEHGQPGVLISIRAYSTGLLDDGEAVWHDSSDQLWRVTLIRTGAGTWMPILAEPAYFD